MSTDFYPVKPKENPRNAEGLIDDQNHPKWVIFTIITGQVLKHNRMFH